MLSVIYEDNHLLCLDKPGGLLTQPSGTDRDSLEAQGKLWLKEKYSKPGAVFLEAAHRIDTPVCGVVLFARTSKALTRLNAAVRAGECHKEYHALVEGRSPAAGVLRNWLVHDEHQARVVKGPGNDAKEATLEFEVLEKRDGLALLRVVLGSGRYHQIRAQLAYAGMPIVGDAKYGAQRPYRHGCIALQHFRLTIRHPVGGAEMVFQSKWEL